MNINIYNYTPVNSLAGMVTGQSGCIDELSPLDKLDNLKKGIKTLRAEMEKQKAKSAAKREIAMRIMELDRQVSAIRKAEHIKKMGCLTEFIIEVLKEKITKFEWDNTVKEAQRRKLLA